MDPLSLTTLQKSFNMAVLFQPSIVLKPKTQSTFILRSTLDQLIVWIWLVLILKVGSGSDQNQSRMLNEMDFKIFSGSLKADDQ